MPGRRIRQGNGRAAVVWQIDPTLPVSSIQTMQQLVMSAVADRRLRMVLTGLFAVVVLLLEAVGVYGVVSDTVVCRTRDIGLRLALGATRPDIVGWAMSLGMRPVFIGLAVDIVSAMAIAITLKRVLFGIAPTDPVALGGVAALLLSTAAAACSLPARRAAELNPIVALRSE